MEHFLTSHHLPVYVSDTGGNRPTLVLLHGYLETLAVWDDFVPLLERHFRVLRLDLPGHGLSGTVAGVHSMEWMAEVVHEVLQKSGVARCVMCGHSMGGYVALAFAEAYPEMPDGLCLLHSTPNPDTPQKQEDRTREMALIRAGKLLFIVQQSIPRLFAEGNVQRLAGKIDELIELTSVHPPDGLIACIEGMKQRPSRNGFLSSFTRPLLLVFGEHDRHISLETARQLAAQCPSATTLWLKDTGHAGFIEEPENCAKGIISWFQDYLR